MGLHEIIEEHEASLTAADRKLVRVLLTQRTEAAFLSAADLAARAQVHEATAVRLAQKLGFKGYPDLRAALQAEVLEAGDPALRVRRRLGRTGEGDVLADLVEAERLALEGLLVHIDQAKIEEAARMLVASRRVFVFALGNASSLADLAIRRLRRAGFAVVDIRFYGRELAERLVSLGSDDAIFAFAFRRTPTGLVPLLEHAGAVGARTVLIGDATGQMIRPRPHCVLAAPRGAEEEFQTLTVPMAIVNALILTIARLDQGRSLDALERLGGLIRTFETGAH